MLIASRTFLQIVVAAAEHLGHRRPRLSITKHLSHGRFQLVGLAHVLSVILIHSSQAMVKPRFAKADFEQSCLCPNPRRAHIC